MADMLEEVETTCGRREPGPDGRRSGPRQLVSFAARRECPLHFAMSQLAQVAVTQHVLYEQGEYTARPDLVQELEAWLQMHELVRTRICPASRETRLDERWIDAQLDMILAALPTPLPDETRGALREMLAECVERSPGDGCPLDREPDVGLLGDGVDG